MPGVQVAVASAVVMILRRHVGTEMARATGAHRMGWYSISGMLGIPLESAVTVTSGVPANVQDQGQGHLGQERSDGEAKAGTLGGGAIVTVTDIVTDGAKLRCKPDDCLDRSF
jgi:hypothetical protein